MSNQAIQPSDPAVLQQHAANKSVVEAFFKMDASTDLETRLGLFTDDIHIEEMNTRECLPRWVCGIRPVRQHYEKLAESWTQFSYSDCKIYLTENPEVLIASAYSQGVIKNAFMITPHPYDNYNIFLFQVVGGKIRRIRHFCNPMKLQYAYWNIWLDAAH